jgi:hypothetical protein
LCLWIFLKIAFKRGIPNLQVLGGSKMIIEWAKGKYKIENLLVQPIMERVTKARSKFGYLSLIMSPEILIRKQRNCKKRH